MPIVSKDIEAVADTDDEVKERQRRDLSARLAQKKSAKYARVLLAALSGIPWVGSFLGAAGTYSAEVENEKFGELQRLWLEEHDSKLGKLSRALTSILARLENFGEDLQERIQSEEYLSLVRQGFRAWDQAETDEKRDFIRKLLENAGGMKLCEDDLIRLFINWIDSYHESHFSVIRVLHQNEASTRAEVWADIHGGEVREDSAEADLFKLLIRDLSTGGVIRQHRDTTADGQFRARKGGGNRRASPVMKSAFDDREQYELTELGKQFVRYTMDELVTQLGADRGPQTP